MKKCSSCGLSKPLDQFYKDLVYPSGFRPECKACKIEQVKQCRVPLCSECLNFLHVYIDQYGEAEGMRWFRNTRTLPHHKCPKQPKPPIPPKPPKVRTVPPNKGGRPLKPLIERRDHLTCFECHPKE